MNFIEEAVKTKSPNFYGDKVAEGLFGLMIRNFITDGNDLDKVKKTLFYGKHNLAPAGSKTLENPGLDVDIIHGILGLATESVEMVEAMANTMLFGEEFDKVNLKEEMGDAFWYLAILAKALGLEDFDDIQETVIKKLRHRFPEKYSDDKANNRDLDGEREILENG